MEDPKANILHLVNQWLSSSRSGTWLLILDNADDTDLFFGKRAAQATQADGHVESPYLSQFLPQTQKGSILITSRDEATAIHLTGGPRQVLRIDVMSEDDTLALLTKKLPTDDPSDMSTKKELISELDRIPLAITQASAYITINAPRMTVAMYLQMLRQTEQDQIQLLSNDETDLRRHPEVPNSVIKTWQISFWQIKAQKPNAADLLSRMCMLDRQGIPEFLICQDYDQSLDFANAIAVLLQFSLVVEEKGKNVFSIHRLVQLATRKWIETCGELERLQEDALNLVWRQYPDGGPEDWTTCEALEPHAHIVREYSYNSKYCRLRQADIFRDGAFYARSRGRFSDSETLIQKAVEIRCIYLESDDPQVSASVCSLAKAYSDLGRSNEAEELATKVLKHQKSVLGVDDPITLDTLGVLGDTYIGQGRWTEAEKLYKEVQEVTERVLGAQSPEMLTAMGSLAVVYIKQARWTEAKDLIVQVLEAQIGVLGAEHPDTLRTIGNLAVIYDNQRRWTEAEKLNVDILEVKTRVLGAEHPDTLTTISNLAAVYTKQTRWTEAEDLVVQVLEVQRRVLGAEHPETLATMGNLAVLYRKQARLTEAKSLNMETLEVRRRMLGAEHPDTLVSMNNLASTYYHQNRHSEAIELMEKVVELEKKSLGPEHPDTLSSMHNLSFNYRSQNRYREAIDLMEKVVEIRKKNLGSEHPGTIGSTKTLARWKGTQSST